MDRARRGGCRHPRGGCRREGPRERDTSGRGAAAQELGSGHSARPARPWRRGRELRDRVPGDQSGGPRRRLDRAGPRVPLPLGMGGAPRRNRRADRRDRGAVHRERLRLRRRGEPARLRSGDPRRRRRPRVLRPEVLLHRWSDLGPDGPRRRPRRHRDPYLRDRARGAGGNRLRERLGQPGPAAHRVRVRRDPRRARPLGSGSRFRRPGVPASHLQHAERADHPARVRELLLRHRTGCTRDGIRLHPIDHPSVAVRRRRQAARDGRVVPAGGLRRTGLEAVGG